MHSFLCYTWIDLSPFSLLSVYEKAPSDDATCRIYEMSAWIWHVWDRSYRRPRVFWAGSCSPGRVPWVISNGTRHLCLSNQTFHLTHRGTWTFWLLFCCCCSFNLTQMSESEVESSFRCHCEKFSIGSISLLDLWPCFSSHQFISGWDTRQQINILK